jgi:hypothetical protein
MAYLIPEPPAAGPARHEPAALGLPDEPECRSDGSRAGPRGDLTRLELS